MRGGDRLPWGDYQLPPFRRPYGKWRTTTDGYTVELRLPLLTVTNRDAPQTLTSQPSKSAGRQNRESNRASDVG